MAVCLHHHNCDVHHNILFTCLDKTCMISAHMSAEISSTSSIGAAWPPVATTNERMRGFYPEVVTSSEGLEELVAEFATAQKATEDHPTATRLSMRAVVDRSLIPELSEAITLEGALPVAKDPTKVIAYAAWNDPNRIAEPIKLAEHRDLITSAQARPLAAEDPYEELRAKGFEPHVINGNTSIAERRSNQARFSGLYSKFDFGDEDVLELLENPNNTIAYIEGPDGSIVSTVLAERGVVPVGGYPGGELHVAEITEAVTDPDSRGQGLYRALSGFLAQSVLNDHHSGEAPLDALYGESNLSSPGVIISAHRNRRRFSADDAEVLGIREPDNFGILQQNVTVNDGRETRPYNDFALTYFDLNRE